MNQVICNKGEYVKIGLEELVKHIVPDSDNKCLIFCNSRSKAQHYCSELESKLNNSSIVCDVIVITGALNKHEKFWRIRILLGSQEFVIDCCFRVGVCTNACNVGIDDSRINYCVRFGLPRDLNTYFQERGRGSRQLGSPSTFVLYVELASYANIVRQILGSCVSDDAISDMSMDELQLTGLNSAISPLAIRARREIASRNASDDDDRPAPRQYDLTPQNKRDIKKRSLQELADVMKFFFLDLGCQHLRGAEYLSLGVLDNENAIGSTGEPCNSCPICCEEWKKMHLPVYREQIVRFFQSSTGRSVLPLPVSDNDPGNLTDILKKRAYWVEWIFDRPFGQIKKRQLDALMLSLIAAGIIRLRQDSSGNFTWDLAWVDSSTPMFILDNVWVGINLHEADRSRTRIVTISDNM
eukprot:scaffold12325_cov40-Cyclotella_meneghiniana.AAC.3